MYHRKFHNRFQKQKNDLIQNNELKLISEIFQSVIKNLNIKKEDNVQDTELYIQNLQKTLDELDTETYVASSTAAIQGHIKATSLPFSMDTEAINELMEICIDVSELFQDNFNLETVDLSDIDPLEYIKYLHIVLDKRISALYSSIEKGFFYGYIKSGKSIRRQSKDLKTETFPLTGTLN